MHKVILAMIVVVVTFPFLVRELGWLPRFLVYAPEILSMLTAAYVIVIGVQGRFRYVRPVYWLVLGALLMLVVISAISNSLQPGPMFAGTRNYLRALPFFLLPAVLLITDRQLRVQLAVLLALCAIQLPIAIWQRLRTHAEATYMGWISGGTTGDLTFGTLMSSGRLTLFLIAAACILTGFFLRGRLSAGKYLALLLLVLLPTTINETKITLFLLPVALLTVFLVGSEAGTRLKNAVVGILVSAVFLAIFISIYDYFMAPRWGYGLLDFITMEGRMEGYLTRGAQVGDRERGGTFDGTIAAWVELSRDPVNLLLGYGIGNASDSALGAQFDGEYFRMFQHLQRKSITYLLLEYGVLGVLLVLLLMWLIFLESVRMAQRRNGIVPALALGWCGVSAVLVVGLTYSETIASEAISYLYWYFSGVLVAASMRDDLREQHTTGQPANT